MTSIQGISVDLMRQILSEVIESLESPDYASKLDEAKEAAGNEMLKMMQIVFPMVVQIEMETIKRHGFSNSREGIVQFTQLVRDMETLDGEVARLHSQIRSHYLPPVSISCSVDTSLYVCFHAETKEKRLCKVFETVGPQWDIKMLKKRRYKYFACVCVLVYTLYFVGVCDYIYSKNFETEFDYPLNINITPIVEDVLSGKKSRVEPINYYPYKFLTNLRICNTVEKLDLLIAVKSAMDHFNHRSAIRQTYGQEDTIPGRIVKTMFFLGISDSPKSDLQKKIDLEMALHKDIIQVNFHDKYFNNTIKTMMTFRWIYEHCATADFYLFTDDDMYISVANLFEYVQDQTSPEVTTQNNSNEIIPYLTIENTMRKKEMDLYAGYVFKSTPQRFRSSKWRVSLDEYAWNKWPTYVTAGAYVVSNKSMRSLYVGSLFVKHFKFDDIYLGIVAKKLGIEPKHCPQFYFFKKPYTKGGYRNVIASHGYDDYEELIAIWREQNEVTV